MAYYAKSRPKYRFVEALEDLISPEEYAEDRHGQVVRLRLKATSEGVEILGDAVNPMALEALLECLDPEEVEEMLCG